MDLLQSTTWHGHVAHTQTFSGFSGKHLIATWLSIQPHSPSLLSPLPPLPLQVPPLTLRPAACRGSDHTHRGMSYYTLSMVLRCSAKLPPASLKDPELNKGRSSSSDMVNYSALRHSGGSPAHLRLLKRRRDHSSHKVRASKQTRRDQMVSLSVGAWPSN